MTDEERRALFDIGFAVAAMSVIGALLSGNIVALVVATLGLAAVWLL